MPRHKVAFDTQSKLCFDDVNVRSNILHNQALMAGIEK
jgi:hypothetical protein